MQRITTQQSKNARAAAPKLEIVYTGPVVGAVKQGVLLANLAENSAVEHDLVEALLSSLGPVQTHITTKNSDLSEFSLEIPRNPKNVNFVPFFFDRGSEYGSGHKYYEGLVHALPERDVIHTCTARYDGGGGTGVSTPHLPATYQISAFIECLCQINGAFLEELKKRIHEYATKSRDVPQEQLSDDDDEFLDAPKSPISEKIADEFITGIWRNIAIQIHFSGPSLKNTMHLDHIFSALHMGITLHGSRTVSFAKKIIPSPNLDFESHVLHLQAGDVYCTTPAGILHGVCTSELKEVDRSVALQCRTLLGGKAVQVLSQHTTEICTIVGEVLQKFPVHIPTYVQWEKVYKEMIANATQDEENFTFFNNTLTIVVFPEED